MSEPVLRLENTEVHFTRKRLMGLADSQTIKAVDEVNLDIEENDVIALVGESGCGKTTLGKTAIGLQRPTGGRVLYRGQDIWEAKRQHDKLLNFSRNGDVTHSYPEIRRNLQIVHQDPQSSLNPNYMIESLLADPLKRWEPNLSYADRQERIFGLLEYVGMTPAQDFANRYPHQLSGGEQQRVALIRSLLLNPDVILADEAISALDVSLRVDMMDLMLQLQEQFNTSYLFISHDLSNARYLAEKADGKIGIMYMGELVEIGPAEEIISNPKHPYTQVLLWATGSLRQTSDHSGPPIRSIDIPDLDDPPSGCRFHTRCLEAREACQAERPEPIQVAEKHDVACFREYDSHPYETSEPLLEDGDEISPFTSD